MISETPSKANAKTVAKRYGIGFASMLLSAITLLLIIISLAGFSLDIFLNSGSLPGNPKTEGLAILVTIGFALVVLLNVTKMLLGMTPLFLKNFDNPWPMIIMQAVAFAGSSLVMFKFLIPGFILMSIGTAYILFERYQVRSLFKELRQQKKIFFIKKLGLPSLAFLSVFCIGAYSYLTSSEEFKGMMQMSWSTGLINAYIIAALVLGWTTLSHQFNTIASMLPTMPTDEERKREAEYDNRHGLAPTIMGGTIGKTNDAVWSRGLFWIGKILTSALLGSLLIPFYLYMAATAPKHAVQLCGENGPSNGDKG